MKNDELSFTELLIILIVIAYDNEAMPIQHDCWNDIIRRLKDAGAKMKLSPTCLKKMRLPDSPDCEPEDLCEAFFTLRASHCIESIMPSNRDYVNAGIVGLWRKKHASHIKKMGAFLDMAVRIIKNERGKVT